MVKFIHVHDMMTCSLPCLLSITKTFDPSPWDHPIDQGVANSSVVIGMKGTKGEWALSHTA